MFTAYASRGGAQDFGIEDSSPVSREHWEKLRRAAVAILRGRGHEEEADILASLPIEIRDGVNFFGDEFAVGFAAVSLDRYLAIVEEFSPKERRPVFGKIASALNEVCPFLVRFIAFDTLLEEGPPPVPEPDLRINSKTVQEALADARQLIATRGSTSGVDRAHTAFHGYLRALAEEVNLDIEPDADVPRIFRVLRDEHPKLAETGARAADITQALRALGSIVAVLNPLRNRASLAHPNAYLLDPPEAYLVLNCINTLLHYLDRKLES